MIFTLIIILIIFVGWIYWIFNFRKTVRENKLNFYSVGYAIFRGGKSEHTIVLLDGLLGVNQKELIFVNHFKDDASYLREEISNICNFNISSYNENDFLKFVNKNCLKRMFKQGIL